MKKLTIAILFAATLMLFGTSTANADHHRHGIRTVCSPVYVQRRPVVYYYQVPHCGPVIVYQNPYIVRHCYPVYQRAIIQHRSHGHRHNHSPRHYR